MSNETWRETVSGLYKITGTQMDVASVFYILTLRKMIDENACSKPEYMNDVVQMTKTLYSASNVWNIDELNGYSRIIEETYSLQPGILEAVLRPTIYQTEDGKRILLDVLRYLMGVKLDSEGYRDLSDLILRMNSEKAGKLGALNASSEAIAKILSIGADVKDGDTVIDGTVGYGYSAMHAIAGKETAFFGMDINPTAVQVSSLYGILSGRRDWHVRIGDFTTDEMPVKADKVIMDIPFGGKIRDPYGSQVEKIKRWMDTDVCREEEAVLLASGLDALNDDGRLAVLVPAGFLFRQSKAQVQFRNNLLKEGLLKTVVALPPVHDFAAIPSYMLILQRGNKEAFYVDAQSFVQRERRSSAVISDENANRLKEILNQEECIEKVSFKVSYENLLKSGDWSINQFTPKEEVTYRPVKEIETELEEYYRKLDILNTKSREMV